MVVVSRVPSGGGGSVATDGRPTRGSNCSAVSELWYLDCPAGRGWGNHPDTPHRHTPNSADKDNHRSGGTGGLGGCFLGQR